MRGRDGRDDANDFESTDWLLAQLGQGRRPDLEGHDAPEVAEEAAEPPAEPVAQPPAEAEPAEPHARRSDETLDWFSLAEPASKSDAATRELPVVGEPIEPREPTAPPQSAPPAGPAWTSPFGVRPPAVPPQSPPPSVEAPSRLTSVEPPVGTGATALPAPPAFPPVPPAAPPAASPAETPPAPPPGPVTPPASFALTWGEPQVASEAGLREAFRQLSEPSAPPQPAQTLPDAAQDSPAPSTLQPQASAPVQQAQPPAPSTPTPAAPPARDEPIEAFPPPPAAPGSAPPVPPPPASGPPSWDDLAAAAAAAAAARSAQANRSAPAEPQPPTGRDHSDDYADELWSAMHESDPQPPAPEQAPPAVAPPAFEAFGAFAAFGGAPAESEPEPEPGPQPGPEGFETPLEAETSQAGPPQFESPQFEDRFDAEPRGRFAAFADDAFEAPVVPTPAFGAPPARAPFEPTPDDAELPAHQAFTPAPFGNPTAFGGPAPVDDLLAALGGGLAAGHGDRGTFGQSVSEDDDDSAKRPLPPMTGPIPSGFSELGLALGAASSYGRQDDEPDERGENEDTSSIARQIAETGYFWNLTPDPGGVDPKIPADAADSAVDEAPGPRQSPEPEPEREPEPEPFAVVRPPADPAAPDTDPFGLRQVFGDERDPFAARAAQAAPADRDASGESLPTAAMPAARPNGGARTTPTRWLSIFGAGPNLVDATFPEAQADPWATARATTPRVAAGPAVQSARPARPARPSRPGVPAAERAAARAVPPVRVAARPVRAPRPRRVPPAPAVAAAP